MTAAKRRRKLYPMPVDGLFTHPKYVSLPVSGRGMLLSICEHYWRTDCADLPRDDDQLFAIARAHRPTWRHHKATILEILKDFVPEMKEYFHLRETKGTTLSHMGYLRKAQKARDAATGAREKTTPVLEVYETGHVPKKLPPANRPAPIDERPARPKLIDRASGR